MVELHFPRMIPFAYHFPMWRIDGGLGTRASMTNGALWFPQYGVFAVTDAETVKSQLQSP